jgi:hypothetical protein
MNLPSAAKVTLGLPFLWWSSRDSFITALDGFCNCTGRNSKFLKFSAMTDLHVLK